MTRRLAHRGPDDEGLALIDPRHGRRVDLRTDQTAPGAPGEADGEAPHTIALGHRRFSIVDPSVSGHQPFWSADGSIAVVFNGEIYNYVELREELAAKGHVFATRSDTEVLVEAYRAWGTGCLDRFNGPLALALYDAERRRLLLARDRIGKAPLYWLRTDEGLFFASEIKALASAVGQDALIVRPQAVVDYLADGQRDVGFQTFYENVHSFPFASFAWIESDGSFEPSRYWHLDSTRRSEGEIAPEEATLALRDTLGDALRIRARADVPVGYELSGGMDSSSLVGLGASSGLDVCAFTVAFPGNDVDEEPYARALAERYPERIDYQVLADTDAAFFERAHAYVDLMDEPFHSPNMLSNQMIWRKMAERGIRVSINGGGGDELLAGYGAYWGLVMADLLLHGRFARFASELAKREERPSSSPRNLRKNLGRALKALRPALGTRQRGRTPDEWLPFTRGLDGALPLRRPAAGIDQRLVDDMTHWQMAYWLRSGNVSSLGVPVEVRFPFLDYRVIELCYSLPVSYLLRDGWTKWILRQVVKDVLPPEVVWRAKKSGFPFPLPEWLATHRVRFLAILAAAECPFLDVPQIEQAWDRLVRRQPLVLWRLVCLGLWWTVKVRGARIGPDGAR